MAVKIQHMVTRFNALTGVYNLGASTSNLVESFRAILMTLCCKSHASVCCRLSASLCKLGSLCADVDANVAQGCGSRRRQ